MYLDKVIKLELTQEQIEILIDAVNAVDANSLYGPGHYEDTTGFFDSKDYQLELIWRQLSASIN